MRHVFDIVGPIMIGPSSSHTAGAARLGLIARKILGEEVTCAEIGLCGSFAQTYRGHGTDKAIIAGILGFTPDDERIRHAPTIAKENGVQVHIAKIELPDTHPNTAVIKLVGQSGHKAEIQGASTGGGNILVSRINGYEVRLTGAYPALLTVHRDCPGVITAVTGVLARYAVNIAFMRVSRTERGERAMMILELDEPLKDEVVNECCKVPKVEHAFAIPAI